MVILEGCDYFVRVVDLPIGIGGMVTPNEDGTYSVYINARNTRAKQLCSCGHEVGHIRREDFWNGKPIEEVEADDEDS